MFFSIHCDVKLSPTFNGALQLRNIQHEGVNSNIYNLFKTIPCVCLSFFLFNASGDVREYFGFCHFLQQTNSLCIKPSSEVTFTTFDSISILTPVLWLHRSSCTRFFLVVIIFTVRGSCRTLKL